VSFCGFPPQSFFEQLHSPFPSFRRRLDPHSRPGSFGRLPSAQSFRGHSVEKRSRGHRLQATRRSQCSVEVPDVGIVVEVPSSRGCWNATPHRRVSGSAVTVTVCRCTSVQIDRKTQSPALTCFFFPPLGTTSPSLGRTSFTPFTFPSAGSFRSILALPHRQ